MFNKGPTLILIKANGGYVFGGFSDIGWSEEIEENYKQSEEAFLFSVTDGRGRGPIRLDIKPGKEKEAIFTSRTLIGFGAGPDLHLNLIDAKRSESTLFNYPLVG